MIFTKKHEAISKKYEALDRIKDLILSGEIEYGRLFSENEISELIGMSRTPVGQALFLLARKNDLVEQFPQAGVRIRDFSHDEIQDILEIRLAIELLTVKRCILNIRANHPVAANATKALTYIHSEMKKAHDRQEGVPFVRFDFLFHEKISEISGLNKFVDIDSFFDKWVLISQKRILSASFTSKLNVIQEHEEILKAIKKLDIDEAQEAMLHHLQSSAGFVGIQKIAPFSLESKHNHIRRA